MSEKNLANNSNDEQGKRVVHSIALPPDLMAWAKAQADLENRSLNNFVETLIQLRRQSLES